VIHLRHHASDGTWVQDQIFAGTAAHAGAFSKIDDGGDLIAYSDDFLGGQVHLYVPHDGHWDFARTLSLGGNSDQCTADLSGNGAWLLTRSTRNTNIVVTSTGPVFTIEKIPTGLPPGYEQSGISIAGDGSTIAVGGRPTDVDASGYVAANWRPQAQVFRRDAAGHFQRVTTFMPDAHQSTEYAKRSFFGETLRLSHDGGYVAVADPHDSLARAGVWPPAEIGNGGSSERAATGAVYLFERYSGGYRLRRHIGPEVQDGTLEAAIGAVAFGDNGKTLAIAEPLDDSSHTGVGPYLLSQTPIGGSGAVWLY